MVDGKKRGRRAKRRRLPNRRDGTTVEFQHSNGVSTIDYRVTWAPREGEPLELFVNASKKVDSYSDVNAADAAIYLSLALQYGCPAEVARAASKRNRDGSAMGPVGHALDIACGGAS